MGNLSTKPPSGTRDFLPQQLMRRRYVTGVVEEVYRSYGFLPLETPSFENLSTLLGKYGDEGDQLVFRLLHRRDALGRALSKDQVSEADLADLGLRYDLTVPLARVVAEHKSLPRFFKRYQIQPVWRADRPARGRFREFFQCDVDVIGSESLIAEAEVCSAVAEVLQRLGFADFTLAINHRQLLRALIEAAGIPPDLEQTALVALDKLDKVGGDKVIAELATRGVNERAAKKLLECVAANDRDKVGPESATANETLLATLRDFVAAQGRSACEQLGDLFALLEATPAAGHVAFVPALARGLGYYTGPIFEVNVPDLAGSLGGGGRYDDLIGMFGKKPIPAVGFSLGLERILLVMEEREMYPPCLAGPDVLLCWMGVEPAAVLRVAHKLRGQGLCTEIFPQAAKLGKQLQYADSEGVKAPIAAIVGEDELKAGQLTLKQLASGEQQTVPIESASSWIRQHLSVHGRMSHTPAPK